MISNTNSSGRDNQVLDTKSLGFVLEVCNLFPI